MIEKEEIIVKLKRKLLALALTACMLLSLAPFGALAAGGTPTAAEDNAEATALRYAINTGTSYTLKGDVTLGSPLVISKTFTLDLNGYTITRGLENATNNGYVIMVGAEKLTVKDSSAGSDRIGGTGKITGGYNNGDGGGVYIGADSTFRLESGSISGNKATGCSGVYLGAGSTFTMTGGSITGNCSTNESSPSAGAVAMTATTATFQLDGTPTISGNYIGEDMAAVRNVYLKNNQIITQNYYYELKPAAIIGVTTQTEPGDSSPVRITNTSGTTPSGEDVNYSASLSVCIYSDKGYAVDIEGKDAAMTIGKMDDWRQLQSQLAVGTPSVALQANIACDPGEQKWGPLVVPAGTDVTLDLNGFILDRRLSVTSETTQTNGNVITVNGTLTVEDGSREQSGMITGGFNSGDGGGVYVREGTFTLSGGTISGNQAEDGGGVYAWENSIFTMSGGTIYDNVADKDGGGVYAGVGCAFTMDKGTISGNTANWSGGGVELNQGTFKMNDGSITGNIARSTTNSEGDGGGVDVYNGCFEMTGGKISKNQAGVSGCGVRVAYSDDSGEGFTMSGGEISENTPYVPDGQTSSQVSGGGVSLRESNFTMSDGKIVGNTASAFGGGVYITESQVAITGGLISSNSAQNGGGLYSGATEIEGTPKMAQLTMSGGRIDENKAMGAGGGVFLGDFSTLTMTDGWIYSNNAFGKSTDGGPAACGGGVYIGPGGAFIMGNGNKNGCPQVSENQSDKGGGVYVDGLFTIKGYLAINENEAGTVTGTASPTITNLHDDNVYLPKGKVIKVEGPVSTTEAPPIGVMMANPGVFTTGANFASDEEARVVFQSDDPQYDVWRTAQSQATLLKPGGGGGGGGTPAYKITVLPSQNGTATASKSTAVKNETITVTLAPDQNYKAGAVTVKDANGGSVSTASAGENKVTFTMPASDVTVSAAFEPVKPPKGGGWDGCPKDHTCPIYPFTDGNPKAWYHDGMHYCLAEGYVIGFGNWILGPDVPASRAMLVRIMWNIEGKPAVSDPFTFLDVPDDSWYTDAVRWGVKNGVIKGYSDLAFGPDDTMTREQYVTMMYRYAALRGRNVSARASLDKYTDANQISSWAMDAMKWAVAKGIVVGRTETTLNSRGSLTRAELTTIIQRFETGT